MNKIFLALSLTLFITACDKKDTPADTGCNINKTFEENEDKVSITSGIYGTVSMMEGNCQPIIEPGACTHCAVKRTVKVYAYTKISDAVKYNNSPVFFDSFSTQLIAETETDEEGFFQLNIPTGHYTIVTIEQGKLYANSFDGNGGISPFNLENANELLKVNLTRTYNAVF